MKVTVLMTYFNKGPFVEEAVRSVLASTFTDFELLVVDDASTDGGLDLIRAIADLPAGQAGPRIRILESAVNTGRAAAANRGLEAARGEYIAVLDADDRMLPQRLEKQVAFMDAHPDIGVSGGYLQDFGSRDSVLVVPEEEGEIRATGLFGMPVYYSTCIIRRQVLLESEVRCDPAWRSPGMDHVFMLKLGLRTRYGNLPLVLTEYRRGEQNMRHGRDHWKDQESLVAELFSIHGIATNDGGPRYFCTLYDAWPTLPDAAELRTIHRWLMGLIRLNAEKGWFDPRIFEALLLRRWDALYHRLPDHDLHAAWAHAMLTRPLPWTRLRYLLGQRVRALKR